MVGVSVCGGGGRTPWWFGHGRALPDAPRMVVVVDDAVRRGGVGMGAPCRTRLGWWWWWMMAGRRGGVGMGAPCRTRLGWWWWWMMPCAVVVWAWARPAGRASDGGGGDGRAPWWCERERALPDAPRMVVVVVGWPGAVVVWAWARPAGRASDGGGGGDGRAPWWFGRGRALPDAPRMVVGGGCGRTPWWWARPAGRASDGGGW